MVDYGIDDQFIGQIVCYNTDSLCVPDTDELFSKLFS